jgi:iron complex transport system substrate-binding protein
MIKNKVLPIVIMLLQLFCSQQKQNNSPIIPERIISLAPSITETLFTLGLGDRVIGVTSYCTFPPEVKKIEKVGGYSDANIEKIVSLHPDLVILTREHINQKESLERFNIKTLIVDHSDCSKLCSSFVKIGKVCGVSASADSIVDLFRTAISSGRDFKNKMKPKVLLCIGRDSPGSGTVKNVFSISKGTLYNQIIEAAGGVNAFSDSFPLYPSLSYEGILALQPDIIIDAAATMGDFDCNKLASDWMTLDRLTAVKHQSVFCVQNDYATVPGPRILLLIEDFRQIIAHALKDENK